MKALGIKNGGNMKFGNPAFIGSEPGFVGFEPGFIGFEPGYIGFELGFIGFELGFIGFEPGFIGFDSGIGFDSSGPKREPRLGDSESSGFSVVDGFFGVVVDLVDPLG